MTEPGYTSLLLADLGALLDHIGERGVSLTDTGRLRMADVRAINDRFAVPAELSERFGEHINLETADALCVAHKPSEIPKEIRAVAFG